MNAAAQQHQPARRNFRPLLTVVGAVLAVLVLMHFVVQALFDVSIPAAGEPSQARRDSASAAALDVAELRAAKRSRLASYGWVDRERGIAHIPIEEAMQLVLAQEQQKKNNVKTQEAGP